MFVKQELGVEQSAGTGGSQDSSTCTSHGVPCQWVLWGCPERRTCVSGPALSPSSSMPDPGAFAGP